MAEHSKGFRGFWPCGYQISACFPNVCLGRSKGLKSATAFIFFTFILIAALVNWTDINVIQDYPIFQMISARSINNTKKHHERIEFPLNCSEPGSSQKCPETYPTSFEPDEPSSSKTCPDYFRWIQEDLKQWKTSGITEEMIERGKPFAYFRLVVVEGKAYVEKYRKPYQTRDVFTIWGILQLLRLYPGKVPDLDLMFNCEDKSMILKRDYQGLNATSPPPVFHYSGNTDSLALVFPDWTFWGWAEVNIMPWENMLSAIKKGRQRTKWEDRVPYAYWRGNPHVYEERVELMKCNLSNKHDWNVRVYRQDWRKERKEGFKNSNLEDQCTHRYKIYVEGNAWSVSEKYILACDSMTLVVKPKYFDFFSRSMVPLRHYWPIRSNSICKDLKFAVEWGNNHTEKARAIGKEGSKLMEEFLAMENVYDYMFHSLNEYAKLLKYKPKISPNAKLVCAETMACSEEGLFKKFMEQSMVKSPSHKLPCKLPPQYEPHHIQSLLATNEDITRQVETWGDEY
ncbi:Lipopolysaccharide-modifying protein [Corchorus capsularis]|uniref:Lipopolysaccharide-modifying protein n=1 Tax=Corchorus capsularis TaxID=210143 RepID=A0A1R3I812_COCAP|nr:Lipopolysaccharide-modifying protein [Corchorus capsularis]